jgi:hypothetical protein
MPVESLIVNCTVWWTKIFAVAGSMLMFETTGGLELPLPPHASAKPNRGMIGHETIRFIFNLVFKGARAGIGTG